MAQKIGARQMSDLEFAKETLLVLIYMSLDDMVWDNLKEDLSERDYIELQKWWTRWGGRSLQTLGTWLRERIRYQWR